MSLTPTKHSLLIVDDTPTNLDVLVDFFIEHNFEVFVATDGESALEQLAHIQPDLILLDIMMPGLDGFETCQRIKAQERLKDIPVIFMTALSDTTDKVQGFQVGAVDYITKPIQHEEVLARVNTHMQLRSLQARLESINEELEQRVAERTADLQKALLDVEQLKQQLEAENSYLLEELKLNHNFDEILTASDAMTRVLHQVEQVAETNATVLILGETGTGKELFARAIHNLSPRKSRPLVKVNCASLPSNLIESELFGHVRGAFTGALQTRIGRFSLADGGTIFLDELGELPLELQAKLLRVLQEGEFERLGDANTTHVDVRVIAATNRDLEKAVERGEFRQDLYYRLNVFPLELPPLRQRPQDIPLLAEHFMKRYAPKVGRKVETLSTSAVKKLQSYHWPGNVRELEHVVERAVILSPGKHLVLDDWTPSQMLTPEALEFATLEDLERNHIDKVLDFTDGRVSGPKGAARILDINPKTLESRMKKLGIKRKR